MIEDMTIRNLSPATQQSYLYAVAKFSRHFNRSPDRLGQEDVRAYQLETSENPVICWLTASTGSAVARCRTSRVVMAGGMRQ
jgi:hypothetical protein